MLFLNTTQQYVTAVLLNGNSYFLHCINSYSALWKTSNTINKLHKEPMRFVMVRKEKEEHYVTKHATNWGKNI